MLTLDRPIEFDASPFLFDKRSGRYRYSSGAAKGQFAPRTAILSLTQQNIDRQSQALVELGDRLDAGTLSIQDFQREASSLVRRIHLQSAIIAAQGIDRMDAKHWQLVQQEIDRQLYKGIDPQTGRPYGIKYLSAEVLGGQVSIAQLRQRLAAYANSGKLSFWAVDRQVQQDSGKTHARRSLSPGENCPECVALAGLPARAIGDVPLPGQGCRCRSNCRCQIFYLSLEEALAQGS